MNSNKANTQSNTSDAQRPANQAQTPSPYERPNPVVRRDTTPGWFRDVVSLVVFIAVIVIGAWLINTFIFQSFNVVGPSMEPTLEGEGSSDRLIVNRLPVTAAKISGQQYTPSRGDIIVFKNPLHGSGTGQDEYIVKRVIGLPGERVTVDNCTLKVHNAEHSEGFDPYPDFKHLAKNDSEVNTCVDGDGTDVTVPTGQIFVTGDHRVSNYSMDSRTGENNERASLGTIPLEDIVGPVALRIWPFDKFTVF